MAQNGKGSKPRPIPNRAKFESNWDLIFGKKESANTNAESEESPHDLPDRLMPSSKAE